jgi:hypothetical protein
VERLMGVPGLKGAVRGKPCKTTIPDGATDRPANLASRQFSAERPNPFWAAETRFIEIEQTL